MAIINSRRNALIVSILAIFIVVVVGIWGTFYIGNKLDASERAGLLLRAGTIAKIVDQKDIKDLSGTSSDVGRPSYERLKIILEDVHALNTDSRFIYLMGMRDGKQFFYVDSENPKSQDYSPPGQEYPDASELDIYNHIHSIAYTNGPYTDQWGTWISAYAPIVDKDTDQVLALVGIDVDAKNLLSRIWLAREIVLIILLLVLALILLLVVLVSKSTAHGDKLEKANEDLSSEKDSLLEVEHLAKLGKVTWTKTTNDATINQIVMDLIGAKQSRIPMNLLLENVNLDDVNRIRNELQALPKEKSFTTLKYRLIGQDKKEHAMVSLCKISRNSDGSITRAVCTAQDIGNEIL